MRRNKGLFNKILVYGLIGSTLAGNIMPAMAYDYLDQVQYNGKNSIAEVHATQEITEDNASAEVQVYAELGSEFKVIIPKALTLSGTDKKGAYTVDVEGDIGGTDVIKVVPEESFLLSSTGLADVTATVSQDKTEWSYSEILPDSKTIGNGTIDASGISAGAWEGSFWFNINLEESGSETPVVLEAGLYDADDVMLCSWEDSGIDVEKDYSITTYGTDTSSPYCVITNNYPTTAKVVIPDSVTSIGDMAFAGCEGLTSIKIPDSVTSIGNMVFFNCNNLTKIVVDSDNSVYDSRNDCNAIIETDSNTLVFGCQTTVIPSSVTSIGSKAFEGCTGLTSITIPDSVTSIGSDAFNDCTGLTSIEIPNNVTSIGSAAFNSCIGLTSVEIPDGVEIIGSATFASCENLTSIKIPDSVTSIGSMAFMNCPRLTSITIPDSVTTLEMFAFSECTGLRTIYYTGTQAQWNALEKGFDWNYNCPADMQIVYNYTE